MEQAPSPYMLLAEHCEYCVMYSYLQVSMTGRAFAMAILHISPLHVFIFCFIHIDVSRYNRSN